MMPRLHIANLPTPIAALPRLSAALGGARILIKHDDQTGGLGLSGNKTRKLEFLVAEAQATGARMLITAGAVQSNHCRQTAAAAARFGFDCTLVLAGDPPAAANGNLLLDQLLGAKIVWARREERDAVLKATFDAAWADGKRPFLIPYGGSSPVGAMAYVFALEELLAQTQEADWIVFASSSGGTQAGLAAGARRANWAGKVLGISVDRPTAELQAHVAGLAGEVADRLGMKSRFEAGEILVNDEFLGGGYGVMGEPEREAIGLFARLEGVLLDPVYTGRAAAGLIGLMRRGFFTRTDTVLFWHTGGAPALFAEPYSRQLV